MTQQKVILVIATSFDPHADEIIQALGERAVDSFRLNYDTFLSDYDSKWDSNSLSYRLQDIVGRTVAVPDDVVSVYYRPCEDVMPHPELMSSEAKGFSSKEGEAFLRSIMASPGIKWVSSPHAIERARAKLPQLHLAKSLGLIIPRTLVTNQKSEAYEFAKSFGFNVVTKPFCQSTFIRNNQEYEIFTHRLTKAEFDKAIDSVRYVPTVFQEYIDKSSEIRVTIIGDDIYATEIKSQLNTKSTEDWRAVDPFDLTYQSHHLPEPIVQKLRAFVRSYNLVFSAIDLILTPDGEYVFLENNPNGQWYWLEVMTRQPMLDSMVRLLTN